MFPPKCDDDDIRVSVVQFGFVFVDKHDDKLLWSFLVTMGDGTQIRLRPANGAVEVQMGYMPRLSPGKGNGQTPNPHKSKNCRDDTGDRAQANPSSTSVSSGEPAVAGKAHPDGKGQVHARQLAVAGKGKGNQAYYAYEWMTRAELQEEVYMNLRWAQWAGERRREQQIANQQWEQNPWASDGWESWQGWEGWSSNRWSHSSDRWATADDTWDWHNVSEQENK